MKQKLVSMLLMSGMIASLATGCGGSGNQPASTEAESSVAGAKNHNNVAIEVSIVEPDWADAWDKMEEKFESEYPWIDVQEVGLGEDMINFFANRVAAHNLPDIIQGDLGKATLDLADEGYFEDASKYKVAKDIPQEYLDAFTYKGKLLGLSQGSAFSTMFYNMKLMKEAGWDKPPANFDELVQACKDVKNKLNIAPICIGAGMTTNTYMPIELSIAADVVGDKLKPGEYEEEFKNGKFDFTAYPEVVKKMDALAPYFLEGSASMQQEDTFTAMADGKAAMCLAGNWTAANVCNSIGEQAGDEKAAVATFPPFNNKGKESVTSISPENVFIVTVKKDRTPEAQEAVDTFYEWVYQPENFKIIQNARGTVPVLKTLKDEDIKLPAAMEDCAEKIRQGGFQSVKMGFNCWTEEFRDTMLASMGTYLADQGGAEKVMQACWEKEQVSYKNKK